MEFLKIISDNSSIEIIPLNKTFSIKVIMGKLHINGENKYLKVENSEEFLNRYMNIRIQALYEVDFNVMCIKNVNGYAELSIENINKES